MKTMTLADELEAAQKLLQSYQDLAVEQEEDRKYSEDFIEMQVAQITARVADLKKKIHDNNIQS